MKMAILVALGFLLGTAASILFWYASYALHDLGMSMTPEPEGDVPYHTHPATDPGLMPIIALVFLLVPPLAGAGLGAQCFQWWFAPRATVEGHGQEEPPASGTRARGVGGEQE